MKNYKTILENTQDYIYNNLNKFENELSEDEYYELKDINESIIEIEDEETKENLKKIKTYKNRSKDIFEIYKLMQNY